MKGEMKKTKIIVKYDLRG